MSNEGHAVRRRSVARDSVGTMAVKLIQDKVFGVMVAARGDGVKPVPIAEVAGTLKTVPLDHPGLTVHGVWTCLGN